MLLLSFITGFLTFLFVSFNFLFISEKLPTVFTGNLFAMLTVENHTDLILNPNFTP